MKKIIIVLLLIAFAEGKNNIGLDILLSHFDFQMTIINRVNRKTISLEYGPTHKKDLFVAESNDIASFVKFIDMYILYFSGYGDLLKYTRSIGYARSLGIPPIEYMEFRLKGMGDEIEINPSVTVKKIKLLIKELKIKKYDTNRDEGEKIVDLDSDWERREITEGEIKENFEWYKKHGLISDFRLK